MSASPPWSYSSLNLFQQCPKKYFHLKVAKDIKEKMSQPLLFGNEVHKAAEQFIRDGVEIPKKFEPLAPPIRILKNYKGNKLCELKLGLTKSLKPTGFFDADVWWRGVIDLLIINGNEAKLIDYKTGKKIQYADTKQLDIFASATFIHFSDIEKIKGGFLFLVTKDLIKKTYTKADITGIMSKLFEEVDQLDMAYKEDVWNPKENFTCRQWCPVVSCPHNGKK